MQLYLYCQQILRNWWGHLCLNPSRLKCLPIKLAAYQQNLRDCKIVCILFHPKHHLYSSQPLETIFCQLSTAVQVIGNFIKIQKMVFRWRISENQPFHLPQMLRRSRFPLQKNLKAVLSTRFSYLYLYQHLEIFR